MVTLSGSGCPPTGAASAGFGGLGTTNGTYAFTRPHADGSWSETLVVDQSTFTGNITAEARCVNAIHNRDIFEYVQFPIHVSSMRRLHIEPGSFVHPETTLTITPIGACPLGSGISMNLQTSATNERLTGTVVASAYAGNTGTAGNWSQQMLVPATTPPGSYFVNASCYGERIITAWYEVAPVTVLAADVSLPQPVG